MAEELKSLAITNWYKALVVVSGSAFLITLGTKSYSLTLISLGVFILGLGIWASHRKVVEFGQVAGVGTVKKTDLVHTLSWFGTPLEIAGALIALFGIYRLLQFGAAG